MNSSTPLEYWNEFYGCNDEFVPEIPSQFAAFSALEIDRADTIIDIGCGNGRDSLFFAAMGWDVLGLDFSNSAISYCKEQGKRRGLSRARFEHFKIEENADLNDCIIWKDKPISVYSRFFLHAIDDSQQDSFFKTITSITNLRKVALEFRTHKDAANKKVTKNHYRRFIDPIEVILEAKKYGLQNNYMSQGFGFAKFRDDDAHVARIILTKE